MTAAASLSPIAIVTPATEGITKRLFAAGRDILWT